MTYVITEPQIMAAAAADVEGIGSAISEVDATAAGPTSGLLAPAANEVSAAITKHLAHTAANIRPSSNRLRHSTTSSPGAGRRGNAYANAEGANAAATGGTAQTASPMVTPTNAELTLFLGSHRKPDTQ